MIVIELLLVVLPMLLGIALFAAARLFEDKLTLSATGAIVGLALFTTIAYIVSVAIPVSGLSTIALLVAATLAFIALTTYTGAWKYWRTRANDRIGLGVLLMLVVVCAVISTKLLVEKDGSLSTGILNAWGDLAWHMANISNFAEGQNVPPENPIYAGNRLTYPFLVNFFSALLLTVGASYPSSVVLPALFLVPLTFILFYCFAKHLAASKGAAVIAMLLLFVAGGTLGWWRIVDDFHESQKPLMQFLLRLPQDYTGSGGDSDGFHFLNPILSLLLPQRSFLFGMPLAFTILLLLGTRTNKPASFMWAGIVAGLLPLFHGHTVLALVPPILALFAEDAWVAFRSRTAKESGTAGRVRFNLSTLHPWLLFGLLAGIVGVPEMLYYLNGASEGTSFFRWGPRWMAGEENIVWYWIKNTGAVIPVALFGLFLPLNRQLKIIALSGFVVFMAANLFLFAPWAWDNSKLLIFWLILTLPLIGATAVKAISYRSLPLTTAVITLLFFHGISGSIDLLKTALPTAQLWGEWDSEAIAIAKEIQKATPPGSTILTAPYHNTPVALAGRRMYLGFPGHVWSHGGSHWEREAAVQPFYAGSIPTLPEGSVEYVLVGPVEQQRYGPIAIRPEWILVAQTAQHHLYRLP